MLIRLLYWVYQVREISSASQIKSHAILDSSSLLPELRHNLRLIVDMSKSDLEHLIRERRIQDEKKKSLSQDVVRLSALVEDESRSKLHLRFNHGINASNFFC